MVTEAEWKEYRENQQAFRAGQLAERASRRYGWLFAWLVGVAMGLVIAALVAWHWRG